MFLTSTSDAVQLVTASGVSTICVQASWVDYASATVTPGRLNTNVTTATTTNIIPSPGASTTRNVRGIRISNNSTASCVITIQHTDGTTTVAIEKITLYAGESFTMAEDGEWRHLTSYASEYEYPGPGYDFGMKITGAIAETLPRHLMGEAVGMTMTAGTLYLSAIYLSAGQIVSNITMHRYNSAGISMTNQFFALYSLKGQRLAQSANDTTNAWASFTLKTLAMTTPYVVPVSGLYYVGVMIAGSAGGNIMQETNGTVLGGTFASGAYPCLAGASDTGLTTSLPQQATPPSVKTGHLWASIS